MQWLNPRRSFENGRGLNCCMGYDKMKKAIDKQVKLMYNPEFDTCESRKRLQIPYLCGL